eukprot:3623281-Karenia_brevis.AAC.1
MLAPKLVDFEISWRYVGLSWLYVGPMLACSESPEACWRSVDALLANLMHRRRVWGTPNGRESRGGGVLGPVVLGPNPTRG